MSNPLEEFLKHAMGEVTDKQRQELEHLHTWRESGHDPEHLRPLLQTYQPILDQRLKQWKAPAVPDDAFRSELQTHFVNALKSYDPTKGAGLRTHVENRIQKAKRFNARYQNVARIPEAKAMQIGKIDSAKRELQEQFGRDPTHDEIAGHIGDPKLLPKHVMQIENARMRDVPASAFEDDPTELHQMRSREVLSLLPHELTEDEHTVFRHLYGLDGHDQMTSTNELAKRLGKSPSQVSRLRTSILNKYTQFL
jgi:DNA-directed RNA polymerase specialized sigma subunit